MQRFSSFLISMVMVVFALFAGAMLTDFTHTFIRFILPLPSVDLAREDFILTGTYLISSSFVVFLAMALLIPAKLFSSPERTAKQVYGWGAAWGSGSLALYLASSSVFPHQLLVGAFLIGILFLFVGFALFGASRDGEAVTTPLKRLTAVLGATFGLLRKPLSWLAILVTLAPLITAVAYVKSQVFRDTVVEFRIQQNVSVEGDWTTVAVNTKTQLLQPIMIRVVPKKTDQMLVLERAGRLYRIGYPDTGTKDLLVDFSGEVGEVNLENGAMGFDFNPRFGEDGYNFVYVYFTSYTPELQTNYLAQFDLSAGDPEAVLASRMNLIELERPPSQYHNGGHVEIGSDNMLYLSIGELDLPDFHQTIDKTLAGGVLRIDVLNQGGDVSRDITQQPVNGKTQGYSIPLDNPFVDSENALGEFYAFGLRNPFRFAFDSETDMIWTGDVGSTVWEEVNVVEKGGNYQFPFIEGREKTTTPAPNVVVGNEKEPIYTYRHTAYDRSVIGGIVYHGKRWPSLDGKYIFGDNYSGKFWAMPAIAKQVEAVETLGQAKRYAQRGLTSVIQTPDDRILITIMGSSSSPNGAIVELVRKDGAAEASIGGGEAMAAAASVAMTAGEVHESFVTNCGRCHGETGKGDGPDAQVLIDTMGAAPTNFFTDEFRSRSRSYIRKAIVGGGTAVGVSEAMPPWEGVLEDEEIDKLTDYVLALPQKESAD